MICSHIANTARQMDYLCEDILAIFLMVIMIWRNYATPLVALVKVIKPQSKRLLHIV